MALRRSTPLRTSWLPVAAALVVVALPSTASAADGAISTLVGTSPGVAGDGGPATQAQLNGARGVALAPDGRLLIADTENRRVRQVAANGTISTIASVPPTTPPPTVGGPPPAPAGLSGKPGGVAYDATGQPLVVDTTGHFVGRIGANGVVTIVAGARNAAGSGGDGGPATAARLNAPTAIAVAADGAILIADTGNSRIRRIGTNGVISTIAGDGTPGFSGDGGQAHSAGLNGPQGVSVAVDGSVLIADTGNNRVRRIDASGVITTVAGTAGAGFSGDGEAATAASLNAPTGVAPLRLGGFVIADTANDRLRRVTPLGTIFTIAGGARGLAGDGGPASAAQLSGPRAITPNGGGGFIVADTGNSRVRGLASDGVLPGPVPGRTLRLSPAGGFSTASPLGIAGARPVREPDLVRLGTRINTEKGGVTVETGTPGDGIRTATVSSGQFAIDQPAGPVETVFRLTAPMNGCRPFEGGASSGSAADRTAGRATTSRILARAAQAKKKKTKRKRRSRKIFVQSNGGHRTDGRYADAVVRGTKWSVTDFCTSTRVTVTEGLVEVRDNAKRKTILVPAGERYIARLKKPRRR